MKEEILISIIIPVYNSQEYICACMESILKQININCEIILVNDGSIDNSGKICDSYREKHDFIKVIHQKNGGPSEARNTGIEYAKGKYIIFIDSDDIIDEKAIEKLLKFAKEDESDIIFYGYRCEIRSKNIIKVSKIYYEEKTCEMEEFKKDFCKYLDKWYLSLITNKMYKREIINKNNIKFDIMLKNSEDLVFNFEFMKFCKKVSIKEDILYYYLKKNNDNSISSIYHENLIQMQQYAFEKIRKMLIDMKANNKFNINMIEKQYLSILFSIIYNIENGKYSIKKKEINNILGLINRDKLFLEALEENSNQSKIYYLLYKAFSIKSFILVRLLMRVVGVYYKYS